MATDYPKVLAALASDHYPTRISQAEHFGGDGRRRACPAAAPDDGDEPSTAVCDCIVGDLADVVALAEYLRKNIRQLLINVTGGPDSCRKCQAPIYWIGHKNGRTAPYTVDGLNHFANCPNADDFRRPRS